ncbi:glutathione S-transferase family protein [Achromobacter anxifer]|jgi:glutathione S-transferase|uniref:Disulfide-bond oxidoreductase YfcG n=1 Tax=Achromobacter anxifer TaxID=1287737 RepID=A0A6S7E7U1_9BURK|nr:glutathione S-transferase family protein [Achromobacter anxifer]MDF8363039.1 glutathione S-transferase family protein [Achromobacter anxifer]CAB3900444.1 Disulfide-bond oxidoreductase YfcG [Achromobacter anxifer]
MLTLYDHPRSGNCYKVRLFLALIGKEYESVFVDVLARKNHTEAFERISAFQQIPALTDGELAIWDSHAILLHLAHHYAPAWLAPLAETGAMHAWISVSANEIANSLQPLRLTHVVSNAEAAHHLDVDEALLDVPGMQRRTERVLRRMDQRLAGHDWLAGGAVPTVADIACYGYAALAEEAAIDIAAYPAIAAWRKRIRQLPGYVPPGP